LQGDGIEDGVGDGDGHGDFHDKEKCLLF